MAKLCMSAAALFRTLMEFLGIISSTDVSSTNLGWGFVDGTVRPICHPTKNQKVAYNGHKKVHAIKFQSVVAANGLIANLFGPVGMYYYFLMFSLNDFPSHTLQDMSL